MAVIRAEISKYEGEVQVSRNESSEEGSLTRSRFLGNADLIALNSLEETLLCHGKSPSDLG